MKNLSSNTVLMILLVLAGAVLFIYQRRGRPDPITLTETQKDPFFWDIMSLCRPVSECEVDTKSAVARLSQEEDEVIFGFEDTLADLLALLYQPYYIHSFTRKNPGHDDAFLYARCSAMIHGLDFFERVREGLTQLFERKEAERQAEKSKKLCMI